MRVFRFTENEPIYVILANVGGKKKFFLYDVTIAACIAMPEISLNLTDIFTKREKSGVLFHFCFCF